MLNQLVKHTSVSTRFSANMVALVGAQPRTLNLKEFLQHFLDFRWAVAFGFCYGLHLSRVGSPSNCGKACVDVFELRGPRPAPALLLTHPPHNPSHLASPPSGRCEVVERRARHELGRAQQRLHLVDGFLSAMAHLDAVVQVGCCGWVGWVDKHSS